MKTKATLDYRGRTGCDRTLEVRHVDIYYNLRPKIAGTRSSDEYSVRVEESDPLFGSALELAHVKEMDREMESGYASIDARLYRPSLDDFGHGIPPKEYETPPTAEQLLADERRRVLESIERWPHLKDGWLHLAEVAAGE